MGEGQEEIIKFYKKRIEPFVAIFILVFLITACILLYEEQQIKKEIKTNCGWETEDYKCYCDKAFVDGLELKLNGSLFTIENVSVVR